MLYGPCADVERVALDPLPEMVLERTVGLVSMSRKRFVDFVLMERAAAGTKKRLHRRLTNRSELSQDARGRRNKPTQSVHPAEGPSKSRSGRRNSGVLTPGGEAWPTLRVTSHNFKSTSGTRDERDQQECSKAGEVAIVAHQ
jgi:hypothetical protein